jgi:hypothetical protein
VALFAEFSQNLGNILRPQSWVMASPFAGTILDTLTLIGDRCRRYLEEAIVNVPVQDVQADEIWSFVFCKEKTRSSGTSFSPYFSPRMARNSRIKASAMSCEAKGNFHHSTDCPLVDQLSSVHSVKSVVQQVW